MNIGRPILLFVLQHIHWL